MSDNFWLRKDIKDIRGSFFEKVMRRIKTAVKILFAGYAETQGDFIFRDREHLQDFTATLEEAARQVAASGTPN